MKTHLVILATAIATTFAANGAISITGTAYQPATLGSTVVPTGLVLFLIDDTSNGFLDKPSLSGNLTAADGVGLNTTISNQFAVGSTFGGDLIAGKANITLAGFLGGGISGFDNVPALQGKNFALLWLPGLSISSTTAGPAQTFGIISGTDWIMPAANTGQTYSYNQASADDTTFFQSRGNAGAVTNARFATSAGPSFVLVPEPSAALLGVIGVLGMLRRRRN